MRDSNPSNASACSRNRSCRKRSEVQRREQKAGNNLPGANFPPSRRISWETKTVSVVIVIPKIQGQSEGKVNVQSKFRMLFLDRELSIAHFLRLVRVGRNQIGATFFCSARLVLLLIYPHPTCIVSTQLGQPKQAQPRPIRKHSTWSPQGRSLNIRMHISYVYYEWQPPDCRTSRRPTCPRLSSSRSHPHRQHCPTTGAYASRESSLSFA